MKFDIFNGDADGICALHQWRLANPADSVLVTGVKREIALLSRVKAVSGDELAVFDISFESNREAALSTLDAGASVQWFDHHFAGDLPLHPRLDAHIDTQPSTCTSVIVNAVLGGRFQEWAIVAAFGDNLHHVGHALADSRCMSAPAVEQLAELGELLNYNAYGDELSDLHFRPDDLYRALAHYVDPLGFVAESKIFQQLKSGFSEDIERATQVLPLIENSGCAAFSLPAEAWARRVIGVLANRLAIENPARAHALAVPGSDGSLTISVRAPKLNPVGADALCRLFPNGGGRAAAAGINRFAPDSMDQFLSKFASAFPGE